MVACFWLQVIVLKNHANEVNRDLIIHLFAPDEYDS